MSGREAANRTREGVGRRGDRRGWGGVRCGRGAVRGGLKGAAARGAEATQAPEEASETSD